MAKTYAEQVEEIIRNHHFTYQDEVGHPKDAKVVETWIDYSAPADSDVRDFGFTVFRTLAPEGLAAGIIQYKKVVDDQSYQSDLAEYLEGEYGVEDPDKEAKRIVRLIKGMALELMHVSMGDWE